MASTPDGELNLAALRPKSGLTVRLMFSGGWSVLSLLGIVFALVGVGTLFVARYFISLERHYEREGRAVQGVVERKDTYTTRSTTGSGRRRRTRTKTHYRVHYSFTAADGVTRSGKGDIPSGLWHRLEKGSAIDIQYLASDPGRHRPAASASGKLVWLFVLIPAVFGGAGLLMLFFALRRARKVAGLLSRGTLTRGVVEEKALRRDITINNRHPFDIHYTFALPDGTVVTSKDLVLDRRVTDALEVGQPIGILYLPDDPDTSTLFRDQWMKFFQHGG
jgi:hypothetical protein